MTLVKMSQLALIAKSPPTNLAWLSFAGTAELSTTNLRLPAKGNTTTNTTTSIHCHVYHHAVYYIPLPPFSFSRPSCATPLLLGHVVPQLLVRFATKQGTTTTVRHLLVYVAYHIQCHVVYVIYWCTSPTTSNATSTITQSTTTHCHLSPFPDQVAQRTASWFRCAPTFWCASQQNKQVTTTTIT